MAGCARSGASRVADRTESAVGSRRDPEASHASAEDDINIMNIPLTPLRFLRYAQQQFPERTAVVCGETRLSYRQFAERTARLAGALRAMGVQPGDRIAFLSANCHRLLEAYYWLLQPAAPHLPLTLPP